MALSALIVGFPLADRLAGSPRGVEDCKRRPFHKQDNADEIDRPGSWALPIDSKISWTYASGGLTLRICGHLSREAG
jgi:hypothetical protein